MTEKRADSHGYVEEGKGRDSQGADQERGAEMCSLAVAEDIYPTVTPSPSGLEERQFRADNSGHREAAVRCIGVSSSCTRTLGEETEESRETRAQGQSNPVGHDGTLVLAAQATSNFQLRVREHIRKHILLCS